MSTTRELWFGKIFGVMHFCIVGDGVSISMPEPERVAPPIKSHCYVPDLTGDIIEFSWYDGKVDNKYLKLNLVHLSRESAEDHKNFLIRMLDKAV